VTDLSLAFYLFSECC